MAMVRARLGKDGKVSVKQPNGDWQPVAPQVDQQRLAATTESDIARQAKEDDTEAATKAAAWARRVRRRVGLSQADFARCIGVPLGTVRNWEQGKRSPDGAARALLRVLDRIPEAVIAALAA